MRSIYTIIIVIMLGFSFLSCTQQSDNHIITPPIATQPSATIDNSTQSFHAAASDVENIATRINNTTLKIDSAVTDGEAKTPDNAKLVLSPIWKAIFSGVGELKGERLSLIDLQARLNTAEEKSKAYEGNAKVWEQKYIDDAKVWEQKYLDEKTAKEKAQSDATKEIRQKYTWISISCFSVLMISIVLAFSGFGGEKISSLAIGGAVAGAIGMIISIALVQTVALIPWIVGGIGLLAAALIVWRFITINKAAKASSNNVLKLNKINNELVETVEAGKVLMSSSSRKTLFGNGPCVGKVHSIQGEETREFVKNVRQKLTNKAPSLKVEIDYDDEKNKMLPI